ncbi:MAG: PD-(D/E)XK nuclease family protein [Candidatus Pacebacteria bacterium]|nr:PD-(D/E)XK nuclease family protein [Candidatus Paceibacterota bacterium]
MPDKYKSVWISHSSIRDYFSCERLYFLKNVFKDPISRRKINIASPHLTLGVAVHKVIEDLKNIKSDQREKVIKENLLDNFKNEWLKYKGKKGGFKSDEEEKSFYLRGEEMIKRVINNPNILINKIIPLSYFYEGDIVPNYYLSVDENIVLCGSIDWIEYLPESNAIRIVDFKTGRNDEDDDSFQLPIYYLLISNLMKEQNTLSAKKIYEIKEAAYWYLDHDNKKENSEHQEFHITKIDEEKIKEIKDTEKKILEIGIKIKSLREKAIYKCSTEKVEGEGCKSCRDFEKIYKYIQNKKNNFSDTRVIDLDLEGEDLDNVEHVGISDYNQDVYFIK